MVAPAILTSSDRFAATSSIKEEEGDRRGRSDQTPSSSLMEEVAPDAVRGGAGEDDARYVYRYPFTFTAFIRRSSLVENQPMIARQSSSLSTAPSTSVSRLGLSLISITKIPFSFCFMSMP